MTERRVVEKHLCQNKYIKKLKPMSKIILIFFFFLHRNVILEMLIKYLIGLKHILAQEISEREAFIYTCER